MWQFLAAVAVSLVATFVLRPRPPSTPAPSFTDVQVPTAEDGRPMAVVFGCRVVRGPNVIDYGDFRTTPIRVKGGKK